MLDDRYRCHTCRCTIETGVVCIVCAAIMQYTEFATFLLDDEPMKGVPATEQKAIWWF